MGALVGISGDCVKVQALNRLVVFNGTTWDLGHLSPFGFTHAEASAYVQVVFSCHCFTRQASHEESMNRDRVPVTHWYQDGREHRVLDEQRYLLSQKYLPGLIRELDQRVIKIADGNRRNFVTVSVEDEDGRNAGYYSVYFEVRKERKRRLLLRVQSGYLRESIPRVEKERKRVRLRTILQRAIEGKSISP